MDTSPGMRVKTMRGCVYADGRPAPENLEGMIIGYLGTGTLISLDSDHDTVVVAWPGTYRFTRQMGQRPSRSRPRNSRDGPGRHGAGREVPPGS